MDAVGVIVKGQGCGQADIEQGELRERLSVPLSNKWLSDLFNQGVPCALPF